jgi:hypothetical protein
MPKAVSGCVSKLIKVRWPVSLVLSRRALTKYQLIFRHLFHFQYVRRQLCAAWQIHQVCQTILESTYSRRPSSTLLQSLRFWFQYECFVPAYKISTFHPHRVSVSEL